VKNGINAWRGRSDGPGCKIVTHIGEPAYLSSALVFHPDLVLVVEV